MAMSDGAAAPALPAPSSADSQENDKFVENESHVLQSVPWEVFALFLFVSVGLGALVWNCMTRYEIWTRGQQLKSGDNVERAKARILRKEFKETSGHRSEAGRGRHGKEYFISYEFESDSRSTVQVSNRQLSPQAWMSLEEGQLVEVLYLQGRPKSCRLADVVEDDANSVKLNLNTCFMSTLGVVLLGCAVFIFFATLRELEHPSESARSIHIVTAIGGLLTGLVSIGGCVMRQHLSVDSTDNIYDGEVQEYEAGASSENSDSEPLM
eukprot:TRINITY_DN32645_c0_g4_i2.p1 TRINITY_DN32645_c0_g4~~TRINITY_DN32645_c0_g4_i2.p1  ORF type:complete len:267 (+),score=30.56 TRINITY_DN32645_c0_g4_i2:80-880(+)